MIIEPEVVQQCEGTVFDYLHRFIFSLTEEELRLMGDMVLPNL